MNGILLAVSEVELRAASRIVEAALITAHPMVTRFLDEALRDIPRSEAVRFADMARGALLAANIPEEAEEGGLTLEIAATGQGATEIRDGKVVRIVRGGQQVYPETAK